MEKDPKSGLLMTTVCGSCQDAARELYKLWDEDEEQVVETAIDVGDSLDDHSCEDGYDLRRTCDCCCLYWEAS